MPQTIVRAFLEENGYKLWETDESLVGVTQKYQMRVDIGPRYKFYPICNSNDKTFMNVNVCTLSSDFGGSISAEIFFFGENGKGEWCDLKIYSLSCEDLIKSLRQYEDRLMDMWKIFYKDP